MGDELSPEVTSPIAASPRANEPQPPEPMNKLDAFLWGAFGAVVPEILKYYKLAVEHRSMPSDGWPAYVILSILFLTAAGAFTIAWNPESKQKAIWVGASFPALFATLASSLPPLPK